MNQPIVLAVDDDPGMLELLRMRLRAADYDVLLASSAAEALQTLEHQHVDILISDLRMEHMDGMELFYQAQIRWPTLPVIMLTAHGTIREAVEAVQQGIFAFLTKPVSGDELLSTLRKATQLHAHKPPPAIHDDMPLLTRSAKIYQLLDLARTYAENDVNILITGESGTGKELLARVIHQFSARADKPFVAVNCSAIPEDLLESELFGYVKGAFTGATRDKMGLFSSADGGTILLDEIGDMPVILQAKLLRILQEKSLRPLGGNSEIPVDVRVISATNRVLESAIEEKSFRSDLYYRLNVVNLRLPSLRERREDIPLLANHFLEKISDRTKRPAKSLSPEALEILIGYDWPGNIRQLENTMERLAAIQSGPVISGDSVRQGLPDNGQFRLDTLSCAKKQFERDYILQLLQATEGNVTEAAKIAGRNRSDFHKLMKRHHLNADQFRNNTL